MKILPGLFLALFASAAQAQIYTITDLGTLGGDTSRATAINAAGQIAGSADRGRQAYLAFFFSGTMSGLPPFPGQKFAVANALNASGVAAGYGNTTEFHSRACFWANGVLINLGTLPGTTDSQAEAINDSGQIAGTCFTKSGRSRAFLYSGGLMRDLAAIPGSHSTMAHGINGAGDVVGVAISKRGNSRAFVRTAAGATTLLPGFSGKRDTFAQAINPAGMVVGAAVTRGYKTHPTLWRNGLLGDLGTLGGGQGSAMAVNSSGQIVGSSLREGGIFPLEHGPKVRSFPGSPNHAFLYSDGVMTDLSLLVKKSGWTLQEANGINDAGQIVGSGTNPKGLSRAFLLTLSATPPQTPPIISTDFASRFVVHRLRALVVGSAGPNVTSVFYRVRGKGGFQRARGSSEWRFAIAVRKKPVKVRLMAVAGSLVAFKNLTLVRR